MKATSVKIYLGSNTVKIIRKVFKHDVLTKAKGENSIDE